MDSARLRILGPAEVVHASGRVVPCPPKALAILAILGLDAPRAVSCERLVDLIWGDNPPATALNALQVHISSLRKLLGQDCIVTAGRSYALGPTVTVDAAEFAAITNRASALREADAATAYQDLLRGLDLWRGQALSGLQGFGFLSSQAAALEEARLRALEDRFELELRLGHHRRAVAELEVLVDELPHREMFWALLVRALGLSQRQADALAIFARARALLRDELGVDPGPALRQAQDEVLHQEAPALRARTTFVERMTKRSPVRIPPDETHGRAQELEELCDLINQSSRRRWVTVIGPGGVGKTRVATEVALATQGRFRDGAVFVSLAEAQQAADVLPTVCATLGLGAGADPLGTLQAALADLEMLLVCDNAEHVADGMVPLTSLLSANPGLRILVTSRTPTDVAGERCYRLHPLSTARDDDGESPAVVLFKDRLEARGTDWSVKPGDDAVIEKICARCDGLPLALEFAAARAPLLGLEGLLGELSTGMTGLHGESRGAPARHASVQNNLDWSLEMLDPQTRDLLRCLYVFEGGFTSEAASTVAGADVESCLSLMNTLVRHHLVILARGRDGGSRFSLLQITRDYLRDRAPRRFDDALRRRHAEFYADLLRPVPAFPNRPASTGDMCALIPELPNLRTAVRWALGVDEAQLAADLVAGASNLWDLSGHDEYVRWLQHLVEHMGVSSIRRADLHILLGALAANPAVGRSHARAAADLLHVEGDPNRLFVTQALALWKQAVESPDSASTVADAEDLLTSAASIADPEVRRMAYYPASFVLIDGGVDPPRGRACLQLGYELALQSGAMLGAIGTLSNLADLELAVGDISAAVRWIDTARRLEAESDRAMGPQELVELGANAYLDLTEGCVEVLLGRRVDGQQLLARAVDTFLRRGDAELAWAALLRLAWAMAPQDPAAAARLSAVHADLAHRNGWVLDPLDRTIQSQLDQELVRQKTSVEPPVRSHVAISLDDSLQILRRAAAEVLDDAADSVGARG